MNPWVSLGQAGVAVVVCTGCNTFDESPNSKTNGDETRSTAGERNTQDGGSHRPPADIDSNDDSDLTDTNPITSAPPSVGSSESTAADGPQIDAGSDGSIDTQPLDGRRLPAPCTAPLPTGYCLVSDPGDYIGGGSSYLGIGSTVTLSQPTDWRTVAFSIEDASSHWNAEFASGTEAALKPGLYAPAERYPFQSTGVAGLSFTGDGRGCNEVSGQFSIEEWELDPSSGLTRFSATFEQHCEGGATALRGVVNFQASGTPDVGQSATKTIPLSGKIFRVAYSPEEHEAYGIDATNRRLTAIDLARGTTNHVDTVQVGSDICVNEARGSLFIVNKGSSLITEHDMSDLSLVREIAWSGTDWEPTETRFKIYCTPERLYVVDGAWAPALFTVDGLGDDEPVVTDWSGTVAGIGGLVPNADGTDVYYWYQYGWNAGSLSTHVARLDVPSLMAIDQSSPDVPAFSRDPLDAPILLDEARGLVFAKNIVFDALNLSKVVYTLPSEVDTFEPALENAFALDSERGVLASKNFVYELERYSVVVPTLRPDAEQLFFDQDGALWFLSVSDGTLEQQMVALP